MRRVVNRLEGAFTLVFTHAKRPDEIVAARRSSPLVVGIGDGETFVASDVSAFIDHTRDAVELGQDQIVTLTREGVVVTDFHGDLAPTRPFHVDWDIAAAEKGGHDFFMQKEIEEQPAALADTLRGHLVDGRIVLDEQRLSDQELRDIDKVFVVACGTAYHAGLLAKYAIEHWCRIPVEVEVASEFRYRDPVLDRSTLVVAISQSGETADTLEAVRHAREQKARVLAICNTNGAQIPRESDAVLYTHAGPEVGVAATKTFTSQVVACYSWASRWPRTAARSTPTRSSASTGRWWPRPTRSRRSSRRPWSRPGSSPASWPTRRPCCSSAATSATRWPSRARSSSRSSPTCTPRASRPASSSTGRSR